MQTAQPTYSNRTQNNTESALITAIEEYNSAIQEYNAAKHRVERAHKALIELRPATQLEGTEKYQIAQYKVTMTSSITRTIDSAALEQLPNTVPQPVLEQCFVWKPSINLAAFRMCTNGTPYAMALLSAVTAKPAKPSIKVEVQ